MHSLHNPSQAEQQEAALSFATANAGNREGTLWVLSATQQAVLPVAYLLAATNCIKLLQPAVAAVDKSASGPLNSVYACELLPAADLSVRTYNALLKGRIATMEQFCSLKLRDLKWLRNFGKKAIGEVIAYRARLGVPLAG